MGILRKTKSIKLILGEFTSETIAIPIAVLINKLSLKINKSTVYRVLEKLEDDNILYSFITAKGIKYYAKCRCRSKENITHIHPHFECTGCGKIDCLEMEIEVPNIPDRNISSSQFLFQGKCEFCLA
jgi:Fur family ferric uptake transcriptional regulator